MQRMKNDSGFISLSKNSLEDRVILHMYSCFTVSLKAPSGLFCQLKLLQYPTEFTALTNDQFPWGLGKLSIFTFLVQPPLCTFIIWAELGWIHFNWVKSGNEFTCEIHPENLLMQLKLKTASGLQISKCHFYIEILYLSAAVSPALLLLRS